MEAQKWLEENYPKNGTCIRKDETNWIDNYNKTRTRITKLDISSQNLEGELDLSDFTNLEELECWDNNLTSLNVSNSDKLKSLTCSNNHLTQIIYPSNPEQLTKLSISNNNFSQDLSIFSQLKNLEVLDINNNPFFGSLEPLKDFTKLILLNISDTDLNSGVEHLPDSLKHIEYYTNRPDCKLTEYKVSQIQDQLDQKYWGDIHKDFQPPYKKEWLAQGFTKEQTKKFLEEWNKDSELIRPKDAEFLNWFLNFKKLDLEWALENEEEFKDLRDKYHNFETCKECQQPNTSEVWCQSCNAKHFQEDFKNWTSGNPNIDNFIQKCQSEATSSWNLLEWIPYEQFTNIEHIANGGFGKVEKAEWKDGAIEEWNNWNKNWERRGDYDYENSKYNPHKTIALKTLTNSQNLTTEFLPELTLYKTFKSEVSQMVPCYGVSKDAEGNYILVMKFMNKGNLKEYLKKNYWRLDIKKNKYGRISYPKLKLLQQISQGLKDIHRKNLVHQDFHSGNIIMDEKIKYGGKKEIECRITDLGLSKPANETDNSKVYGVMPYVAPEVLCNKPYTQASDVYSFGIIAYEILTCLPPFANQTHEDNLALQICQGTRPQFPPQVKYPQALVDLINRCWNSEPSKRPTMREASGIMNDWFDEYGVLETDTNLYQQLREVEKHNQTLPQEIRFPNYQSNEVWHSKLINTKQITELLRDSKQIEFTIPDELNLQEDPQEQSSHQAQIEIPPKK